MGSPFVNKPTPLTYTPIPLDTSEFTTISALTNGVVSPTVPIPSTTVAQPSPNYFGSSGYTGEGFNGVGGGWQAQINPTVSASGASLWDMFREKIADSGLVGYTKPDGTKVDGFGGLALGAAQGLGNAFMGMQQYNLHKDILNENKRQFNLNFEAHRKTTNAALEDRQRARVASNSSAYQSVGDYMNKYGV